jgi:hypothetical protein
MRKRLQLSRLFVWPIVIGLMLCSQAAVAQSLAQGFRRGFIEGYVRTAVKHGTTPHQAEADGSCIYDVLNAHLTTAQWLELLGPMRETEEPKLLRPLMPQIAARCGHPGRTPAANTGIDIADSIAVTRQLQQLRLHDMQVRERTDPGPHRPLMAQCTARIKVSQTATPSAPFTIYCSDPRAEDAMRQAIIAAGTLRAQPGSTVLLRVTAPFPSP